MADTLSKYVTPEELQASFDALEATKPARAAVGGKLTAAKVKDLVGSFPYVGAGFVPAGKEEYSGLNLKKLAKKHGLPMSKVLEVKKEWDEAYAASLPQEGLE